MSDVHSLQNSGAKQNNNIDVDGMHMGHPQNNRSINGLSPNAQNMPMY
mgnify:CR=1 FL=1